MCGWRSGGRERPQLCHVIVDRLCKLFYRGRRIYGSSECRGCSWSAAGQRRAIFDPVGFACALDHRKQFRERENGPCNLFGFAYALGPRILVAYQATRLAVNSQPGAAAFDLGAACSDFVFPRAVAPKSAINSNSSATSPSSTSSAPPPTPHPPPPQTH